MQSDNTELDQELRIGSYHQQHGVVMSSHAVTIQRCETFAAVYGFPEMLPPNILGRPPHTIGKRNSRKQVRLDSSLGWFPIQASGVHFCPMRCVDLVCAELRRRRHQVRGQEDTPLPVPPPGMLDTLGFTGPERTLAEQLTHVPARISNATVSSRWPGSSPSRRGFAQKIEYSS